ncbi:YfbK domain-containing protein [Polyangium spumosum]|uniref:DUF3520 domain-containing protein n=1 Tax=Polyangium spumosum TaxID=889282 RepID=A0A6N7PZZ8_9BACT|nr:von Willebrand factor type A domain-containing protein [Polyangium spumosum]MRG95855.1 DUF3520 domain-containing protein [Polyangium spumosum]
MTLSKEDPRLASYVLGELDEDKRRALSAEIGADPEIRAEVEALQATTDLLRDGLAERAPAELSDGHRRVVERATRRKERRILRWTLLAAAAVAAAAIPLGVMHFHREREEARLQAMQDMAAFEAREHAKEKERRKQDAKDAKNVNVDPVERRERLRHLQEERARKAAAGGFKVPALRRLTARSRPRADENPFVYTTSIARTTFPLDVDTVSYSLVERFIEEAARRPPKDLVRVDELVNAFAYDDPLPSGDEPLAARAEVDRAPWAPSHRLVRLALKTAPIDPASRPRANLVFVIDDSPAFVNHPDKLSLLQAALRRLASRLDAQDRLTILAHRGASQEPWLPPTPGDDKSRILDAIDKFKPSDAAPSGDFIQRALAQAQAHFVDGVNRVFLATDDHFTADPAESGLAATVREKAKAGITLTTLGFGPMDGPAGQTLKRLAEEGKGGFAAITGPDDARKLVEEALGTRAPLARDVRVEVDFDPVWVRSFRLIGNEDRTGPEREFLDAWKGPVDLYAGQAVTALYELEPRPDTSGGSEAPRTPYLLTLRVRYKDASGQTSREVEVPLLDEGYRETSADFGFAASVAAFGLILRDSPFKGDVTLADVRAMARKNLGADPGGQRARFVDLLELLELSPGTSPRPASSAPRRGCAPGDPLCSEL